MGNNDKIIQSQNLKNWCEITGNLLLLDEWNYEKNGNDRPEMFSHGSGRKKVWWKCSKCGYEWQSVIYPRTKGHGCPKCARKNVGKRIASSKTKIGVNDLATKLPDLLKEWDYSKNIGIDPHQISYRSNKKVWWKCSECGHEWLAQITNRAIGSRCPSCMKLSHTSYSEQTVYYYVKREFPDAINSYSPEWLKPRMEIDVFIPSLKLGIEYDGEAYHDKKNESDKKKTALVLQHNIQLIRIREPGLGELDDGVVSITTDTPVADLSFLENSIIELFSVIEKKYNLKVNKSVSIKEDYKEITKMISIKRSHNSFIEKYPLLANEWNYDKNSDLSPHGFSSGSSMKVWWKCSKCGHEWQASIGSRTKGSGCPVCMGKVANKGINDFQTLYPEIALEWSDRNENVKPDDVLPNSAKKVWWMCSKCGHEWQATVYNRVSARSGCPCCSKEKQIREFHKTILAKNGSLIDTNPDLVKEWDYTKNDIICRPEEITYGSKKKVWWECSVCGNKWQATINSRVHGRGCPKCSEIIRHIRKTKR